MWTVTPDEVMSVQSSSLCQPQWPVVFSLKSHVPGMEKMRLWMEDIICVIEIYFLWFCAYKYQQLHICKNLLLLYNNLGGKKVKNVENQTFSATVGTYLAQKVSSSFGANSSFIQITLMTEQTVPGRFPDYYALFWACGCLAPSAWKSAASVFNSIRGSCLKTFCS